MFKLRIFRRDKSARRITQLLIVLLTIGMLVDQRLFSRVPPEETPYPIRLITTWEPSTLVLLTLVILLMFLVRRKKTPDTDAATGESPGDRRSVAD